MRSPKMAVAVVVASMTMAACGGSGAPSSSGASVSAPTTSTATPVGQPTAPSGATTTTSIPPVGAIDPCGLLTAAELKTATGADYGDGKLDDYGQCTWRVGDATVNNGDGQVVVAVQDAPLDTLKGSFPGGVDVTVSGHAGYWNPAQGLQSMWVDIGGRTLVISLDPVGPDGQAIAQKIAETAVGRI